MGAQPSCAINDAVIEKDSVRSGVAMSCAFGSGTQALGLRGRPRTGGLPLP